MDIKTEKTEDGLDQNEPDKEETVVEVHEKDCRTFDEPCGTWLLLGNGEYWCIPALPLGKHRKTILGKLKALATMENLLTETSEDSDKQIEKAEKLFDAGAELLFVVLRQNYSKLSRSTFDSANLVTAQHIAPIAAIVRGETEIGERLGGLSSGEFVKKNPS